MYNNKDADNLNLFVDRVQLLFKKNKYQEFIEDCVNAIKLDKNNATAYAQLGYVFFSLNDYDKSYENIEKALLINPTCALAHCVNGNLYIVKNKNNNKALASFNKAIEIDGTFAAAYNNRGAYYAYYAEESIDHIKALTDYNKAIELYVTYAPAYNNRGVLYVQQYNEYNKALSDYNKAIELDNDFAAAYNNRGALYTDQLKLFDKALVDFNNAIKSNNNFVEAYNNRGALYADQFKDSNKALADYNKAISINKNFTKTYNNRGALYATLVKEYDKALIDYNMAIELDDTFAKAFFNRGNLYFDEYKFYDKALFDYNKAKELYLKKGKKEDNYLTRIIDVKIQEINGIQSKSIKINKCIKLIMEKIESSTIDDSMKQTKESFKDFINEKPIIMSTSYFSKFEVLRRWNSYTPIIADNYHVSKGGGYFFKLPNCGVVIDPGFNFINNFKASGYKFYEIDHILITHAHNDHTTDLESILTLLHQYNEEIFGDFDAPKENTIMKEILAGLNENITENDRDRIESLAKTKFSHSTRKKHIRIYMSVSTYKKFAPMLNLYKNSDYDIILIKSYDKLPIIYPNSFGEVVRDLEITAIFAQHNDLLSDRDSLGFIIHYQKFVLIYTGDTGYNQEIEKQYYEIHKRYKKYNIVLLAHLGGFKEYEKKYDSSKSTIENRRCFYKNHLGRLGLAKLIEITKPKMCIISEFGEEFRRTRLLFTNIFQGVYKNTFFIPADIGLCLNTSNEIYLIDSINQVDNTYSSNFYNYNETGVCECSIDTSLHYYKKGISDESSIKEFLSNRYHKLLH